MWKVGAYVRLSREDSDVFESNSIINQKDMITSYLSTLENIDNFEFYIDDGFTGTDFNRPGYQRMLEDIKNNRINAIIVKDLSRIGRNYIEVGGFTEQIIPLYNLRFISINDGVDSYERPSSMGTLEISFKNLMNENYSKDTSKKIRSSYRIIKQKGNFVGRSAPFGYFKDPNDKHHLIIDENAAKIVRKVFELALESKSRQEIAKYLNLNHIPTISHYKNIQCGRELFKEGTAWEVYSVDRILKNETYIGNLVQGKTTRVSHKIHNVVRVPEEEWIKVENTHEGIIDREVFYQVQDIVYGRNNMINKKGKYNTFTGHLKCPDCNSSLYRSTKGKDGPGFYYCGRYKHKGLCGKHYISEKDLYNIVLVSINTYINLFCDLKRIIDNYLKQSEIDFENELIKINKIEIEKDIEKYQKLLDGLLDDYQNNNIDEYEYEEYKQKYLYKLNDLKLELEEKSKKKELSWINKFKSNYEFDHLEKKIVDEFIDKIYVQNNGKVDIVFKFKDQYEEIINLINYKKCMV